MKRTCLIILLLLITNLSALSEEQTSDGEKIISEEYMFPVKKKLQCGKATITNLRNILCKGNIIKIAFECCFHSENAKAGGIISFVIPESIYTRQGTLIIPAGTKVNATIINIEKQRFPNKNARIYLRFDDMVFPDCTKIKIAAQPYTKDSSLKENGWMTAGKITTSIFSLGIIGTGIGVGFSFIPHPSKIGVGLAAGIPAGLGLGLITALVTPGLKYHAKAGETINIIICDNLSLPKFECR